jgi:hypothetical protein
MKKAYIVMLLVLSSMVLVYGSAYAVSGQCANCHTMHYSQNGGVLSDWGQAGPYAYLLLDSCIGCHSGGMNSLNTHGAPIVMWNDGAHTGQGVGVTNAGGNFYWVASVANGGAALDSYGHNVSLLSGQDGNIGYTPPGWATTATPGALADGQINGGNSWSSQLTCAGYTGCHGGHEATRVTSDDGIRGSHHSNSGGTHTQASSPPNVGGSYRFLSGINGQEQSYYEFGATPDWHNVYSGETTNTGTFGNKRSISYSCAECHGIFHAIIGSAEPWLRHPTDIELPSTAGKEYSEYNPDNGNLYSVDAPVANTDMSTASSSTVTPGTANAIVMCLSCHRAHGSNQPDILRWNYVTMQAGTTNTTDTGCFICHTCKNGDCP